MCAIMCPMNDELLEFNGIVVFDKAADDESMNEFDSPLDVTQSLHNFHVKSLCIPSALSIKTRPFVLCSRRARSQMEIDIFVVITVLVESCFLLA